MLNREQSSKDEGLKSEIMRIYHKNKGRYGYRRITIALNNANIFINHKKVYRLMKLMKLKAIIRVKKYSSYKGQIGKVAPNLMERDFKTESLEQKYVTDITEFHVNGARIYLSPLIDLHNKEVISYTVGQSANTKLVIDMLKKVKCKLKTGIIVHSDQGVQYQSISYQKYLDNLGINRSMSRRGNCLDNSLAENFFSHLKSEFYYMSKFKTKSEFIMKLKEYIKYYNEERIVTKLKMSPVKYREHCLI